MMSKARFAQFDVANARCARKEDTQKLLACIEMGFGTYAPFNQLVRQTFHDRAEYATASVRRKASVRAWFRGSLLANTRRRTDAADQRFPGPISRNLSVAAASVAFDGCEDAPRASDARNVCGHVRV